ncbi:hypothetical protein D3C78_1910960 [compost metagenome]
MRVSSWSKPAMPWVCQPLRLACKARWPQAEPVSKVCHRAGVSSLAPGAVKVVFEITITRADACCAQLRLNSFSRPR